MYLLKQKQRGLPSGLVVKNLSASVGDMGWILGPGACHGATKPGTTAAEPVHLEPTSTDTEPKHPRARAPQQEKPPQ